MTNEEMVGKYKRLKAELAAAYSKSSWDTSHIHRITSELAAIERLMAARAVY
jgi:hypothetical protein